MGRGIGMRAAFVVVGLLVMAAIVSADTLYLRDGRRITGQLVSIRNGVVEFEERGFLSNQTVRISRDEVRRIDLDEDVGEDTSSRSGGGRPSGLRERDVTVSADVAWNDTGVEVRAGQTLYFSATGRVQWGPERRDGPGGEGNSPYNPNRPIPRRSAAALIGKIGADSTDYFFIGDEQGPIRIRASGRLYLGINDDYLQDNRGNFQVTVYY